jgi:hypothetical protein
VLEVDIKDIKLRQVNDICGDKVLIELVIKLLYQGLCVFIGNMLEKSGLLFECLRKVCGIGFKIVNNFFNLDGGKNLYGTLIVFVCNIAIVVKSCPINPA